MNLKPLYIFKDALELVRKNNILIELLFSYCKLREEEDICEADTMLEILTMLKANHAEFLKEMYSGEDKFCALLLEKELLK